MSGAYTSLDELTRLASLAKHIPLYKPGPAKAQLTGGHQSRLRGRGMDFEEFRNYQPGDDIRTIDWRASARTGKTQTRVYREERERPVLLVVDQGAGLFFGSQLNFKSVTAAEAAALLAWRALKHGDRVGALLAGQEQHKELRPRRSRQHVLQLLQQTVEMNQSLKAGQPRNSQALDKMLARTAQLTHPGSLVIVISDFHGISPNGLKDMALISRHSDLMAIQVFDPLDSDLPPAGLYAVSDGERRGLLNSRIKSTRENYQQQAQQRQKMLVEHMQKYRIPFHRLNCCQPTEDQLLQTTVSFQAELEGGNHE
ncbi:DUF58 domain-containing protein [Sansalvadorimonas sp. 2012CJ34-2]|uniref:DUF58 domain-containing protein n=1 Tax=Parendozoicomonas callyspongiae TaxID=2942213 RepID=A0ABT0PEG8_9GAMM|nr:DUF58 domain-containing protein [Sansalvadorimonas sp. 2012CJ34-2]MCL6269779.1 DUF58 domain-containing protein [Sansalvadorimonas sp. 2012CJ34-2]